MTKTTMSQLSYGLEKPEDLLLKLAQDGSKLTGATHAYDVFNFVVTAAVMYEWTRKYYAWHPTVQAIVKAIEDNDVELFPPESVSWIKDRDCVPNQSGDIRRDIMNAMSICWHTANASKHYHWMKSSDVTAIEATPQVKDWYQYFFTSTAPDLYIEYGGEYYGLTQLQRILMQFYTGLHEHIQRGSECDAAREA
jgi:hypothetical protein